jgi:2-dehydropantoate 2-reductase
MATDMSRLGTPQGSGTEIQYITGFLVRLGERVGVPTPVNRALLELVEAREEIASVSPIMLVRPAGKSRGKR